MLLIEVRDRSFLHEGRFMKLVPINVKRLTGQIIIYSTRATSNVFNRNCVIHWECFWMITPLGASQQDDVLVSESIVSDSFHFHHLEKRFVLSLSDESDDKQKHLRAGGAKFSCAKITWLRLLAWSQSKVEQSFRRDFSFREIKFLLETFLSRKFPRRSVSLSRAISQFVWNLIKRFFSSFFSSLSSFVWLEAILSFSRKCFASVEGTDER